MMVPTYVWDPAYVWAGKTDVWDGHPYSNVTLAPFTASRRNL